MATNQTIGGKPLQRFDAGVRLEHYATVNNVRGIYIRFLNDIQKSVDWNGRYRFNRLFT